ncbi:MAG: metal-dependent phosphohydrolase [Geobacteraceae bacterium]|nr:metal-dependent phosphohydrolase [Geobacteraceae bacterium]
MNVQNVAEIQKWFSDYCRGFDSDEEDFRRNMTLKEDHTYRVRSNTFKIGQGEDLAPEDMLIAESISLLHDVGRFEQYRQFKTFRDSVSVNHAQLGAKIIEDHEVLSSLLPRERSIINRAVESHNAFSVPGDFSEETQFFLKLIRDADKLDIWRVFIEYFRQPAHERASAAGLDLPDKPKCSPGVLEQVANGEMVRLSAVKTLNDFKLMQLAWVYDLNFSASFALLLERQCIEELAESLPAESLVVKAVEAVLSFAYGKVQKA